RGRGGGGGGGGRGRGRGGGGGGRGGGGGGGGGGGPSLLLADAPTGNLDSRTSGDIMQVFQELNEGENLTIVLVTHEPDIADFAKRIITFRDGRILKDERVAHRRIASEVIARMPALED